MGDGADHRTWNIFRRRHAHGLCCAVPSDMPVPSFLLNEDWTFGFQYARGDLPVPGFSPSSAEIGSRYNGFYLFLGFGSRPASASSASFPAAGPPDAEPNDLLAHWPDAAPRPA